MRLCTAPAKELRPGSQGPPSLPACGERGRWRAGCQLAVGLEGFVVPVLSVLGRFLALVCGRCTSQEPWQQAGTQGD